MSRSTPKKHKYSIDSSNRRTTGGLGRLAAAPGRTGRPILENDAGRKPLVPDAVGLGEILRLARSIARCYQTLDCLRRVSDLRGVLQGVRSFGLIQPRACRTLQKVIVSQQAKHPAQ